MLAASLLAAALAGQAPPVTPDEAMCSYIEIDGSRMYRELFMIFFDWDSSAITPPTAATLDTAAIAYAPLGHCTVLIAAHSDRAGPEAYNLALSRRRAEAVIAYLRRRGVTSAYRLEPFGESRPLVETPDGAREPQNRRAEILIIPPTR
ncbi:MAG TPA: OmpA family protein [Allosphingosinicella sp.]|nr:OmpA family protein [Allosphingosinicella sp.]